MEASPYAASSKHSIPQLAAEARPSAAGPSIGVAWRDAWSDARFFAATPSSFDVAAAACIVDDDVDEGGNARPIPTPAAV